MTTSTINTIADLRRIFDLHKPTEAQGRQLDMMRQSFTNLAEWVLGQCPPCVERDQAIAELDSALRWAIAAVVRPQPVERAGFGTEFAEPPRNEAVPDSQLDAARAAAGVVVTERVGAGARTAVEYHAVVVGPDQTVEIAGLRISTGPDGGCTIGVPQTDAMVTSAVGPLAATEQIVPGAQRGRPVTDRPQA